MGLEKKIDVDGGIFELYQRSLDEWWVRVRVPVGPSIFTFPYRLYRLWGLTQPAIQWVPRALAPGVKRPGRQANHSLPSSTEVKKPWIYIYPLLHTSLYFSVYIPCARCFLVCIHCIYFFFSGIFVISTYPLHFCAISYFFNQWILFLIMKNKRRIKRSPCCLFAPF
jgi:hypothetical protein